MTLPDGPTLIRAMEATWPPAARIAAGPFLLGDGQGGGSRVSAAVLDGAFRATSIPLAEAGLAALGQVALFRVVEGEDALDAALAARGYAIRDPVALYAVPTADVAPPPQCAVTESGFPPLAVLRDIWAADGIGPARIAVMERVAGPKAALLARVGERAAGAGFVAIGDGIAYLHAVTVRAALRRQGAGLAILRGAAAWARRQGAATLALAVTEGNAAARAMYARDGMVPAGRYHYRVRG